MTPRPTPSRPLTPAEFCARLRAFVAAHGGPCYRNWTAEQLDDYFTFHLLHGTLAWCRKDDEICGVLVAWQTQSARLDAVCPTGRLVFDWTPTDPAGNAVWVADVVTTRPGALRAMAARLASRFPHWLELPAYTYRPGPKGLVRHRLPVARLLRAVPINPQPMTGGN